MSAQSHPASTHAGLHKSEEVAQVFVYGLYVLCFWWTLEVAGYVMALLTSWRHDQAVIGPNRQWFYPNQNLGVVFALLLFALTVVNSTRIKGMKMALMIAAGAFSTLLFVHLNWWASILGWFGHQSISLSFGFYFFSSTLLWLAWIISVFVIDHLCFCRFQPGQMNQEYLGVIVDNSYQTENLTFTLDRQSDFFRHWFIGSHPDIGSWRHRRARTANGRRVSLRDGGWLVHAQLGSRSIAPPA